MSKSLTILISSLRGGGAEKIATILANNFVNEGLTINLLVLNLKNAVFKKLLNDKIKLINLNVNHARTSMFALAKYFIKNNPKIILVFNHELAIIAIILRFLLLKNTKIVARNISTLSEKIKNEKSIWHKHFKKVFIKLLYGKVDTIIAQSEKMRIDLINSFKIREHKISVINNPSAFIYTSSMFNNTAHSKKKNEILFVGRIEKIKGLNYLLEAFKNVVEKIPQLKLRIVGEGMLLGEIQNYCKNSNLDRNVIFNGFQTNILKYYLQAKLTVLTSLYEGFPNILVESISLGTPVVAFDCKSGPREIIINGVNGFLVKHLDVNDLEKMIIKAYNINWDQKQIITTAKKFNQETVTKKYLKILNI